MNYAKKRPVFLDLFRIHMPVAAILSIGHRLSGVLLTLASPFLLYLFDLSLRNEQGFAQVKEIFANGFVKFVAFILIWSFLHHFFAGIRFLLIDIDIGIERRSGAVGAWIVHASELAALVFVLVVLL